MISAYTSCPLNLRPAHCYKRFTLILRKPPTSRLKITLRELTDRVYWVVAQFLDPARHKIPTPRFVNAPDDNKDMSLKTGLW
jgi:hypothetical protein